MQGKGIVKFFLVVVSLMCLLQYFYMYPTWKVEKDAKRAGKQAATSVPIDQQADKEKATEIAYLDSMGSETVFSIPLIKSWTYDDLKSKQLALGLDLKGGMSVVLQVDLRDFIRSLAGTKDKTFLEKALDNAELAQQQGTQQDYISIFTDEFLKLTDGSERALAQTFQNRNEEIDLESSSDKVRAVLRQKADQTVSLTYERLKDRIDELGVVQPNVSLDAARDLIIVELPGIANPERARKFLQTTAKLEFWDVYRIYDADANIAQKIYDADQRLKKKEKNNATEDEEEEPQFTVTRDTTFEIDSTGNFVLDTNGDKIVKDIAIDSIATDELASSQAGPLLSILQVNPTANPNARVWPSDAIIGIAEKNKMKQVDQYLKEVRGLPKTLEFRWSNKPVDWGSEEAGLDNYYELYAIKKQRNRTNAPLEGDVITNANANPDPNTGEIEVILQMNGEGRGKWAKMTEDAAKDNQRPIAIALDDKIVTAPSVNTAITQGSSSITGGFTMTEAEDLAKILQVGKLPAKAKIIQESLVGPSLGAENIASSITSLVVGVLLVLLFMMLYYGTGGIVSILALFLNLFFIFGTLASLGTVLTLPGIAGIVLTIGMAVDANVIIYERIREELREGKTLLMAIRDGFQHSYSAIIDANVTTILTAIVLAYFGLGPIKGFAVVLIIGVISSLFTAVLVGRLMIDWWTGKGREMSFWTGVSKNAFTNLSIDWLGKRKIAYTISGIVIALGIGSFFMRGFELGVDFKGGYSYNVQFEESVEIGADELRTSLTTVFGATPVVKAVSSANTYNVTTSYLINDPSDGSDSLATRALFEGVNGALGGNLDYDNFKDPDGTGTHITSSNKVGPTIAGDIKRSSVWATVFALLLIFLYIFIRFSRWQYSMGAVAALFHDVLFVLSIFSLFHGILPFSMEIDQNLIAAILTVIGYSINDTVVVFDRIREFMNNYTKRTKEEIINMAINSTISRTVITSLTTLFVVLILFIFGGTSIKGFAFALLIGIIVGTYSSVFIATPVMSDLSGEIKAKESKKSSFSKAAKA